MTFRTVVTDRLAFALLATQHIDKRRAKDKPKEKRRDERPTGPERDVAKQVEKVAAVRKFREPK